jgi:hypothetical protein
VLQNADIFTRYGQWPDRSAANGGREMSRWVRIDKTQHEHNESAYPLIADMGADIANGSFVPEADMSHPAGRTPIVDPPVYYAARNRFISARV